jgi:NhaP-type Na+/H+ or K+/H+ antiporter
VLGLIEVSPQGGIVSALADLALFTVLFVDGGRLPLRQLRTGWRLSGRALGLGMPLTLVLIAAGAHFLIGLDCCWSGRSSRRPTRCSPPRS